MSSVSLIVLLTLYCPVINFFNLYEVKSWLKLFDIYELSPLVEDIDNYLKDKLGILR
jgi:hypothetical protein